MTIESTNDNNDNNSTTPAITYSECYSALFLKPEILCHPHIPKPLHGVAPREIKGQIWWNETRQKAYKSTDYHCVACGVQKHEAKKHEAMRELSMFPETKMNHFIKLLELKNICTKGVFFCYKRNIRFFNEITRNTGF